MGFALGIVLAVVLVAWVLHPVMARRHAPMGRDDCEVRTAGPVRQGSDLPSKERLAE